MNPAAAARAVVGKVVVGSISTAVIERSHCPVAVVPEAGS